MAVDTRLLDDLARVAGGAVSLISTVGRQVKNDLREKADSYAGNLNLASHQEIEILKGQVNKYRLEQETMKKQIAVLEAAISGKKVSKSAAPKTSAKTKPKAKSKK